jgi:hypothetical protein
VVLVIKASYSSSTARHQDGSVRATQMKVGTGESGDDEVADSVSLSASSQKPHFTPHGHRMTGGAIDTTFASDDY